MSTQNLLILLLTLLTLAAVSAIAGFLYGHRPRQLRVLQRHDAVHRAAAVLVPAVT
ncbi:hypothetical protein [Streptomyces sp. NPDC093223]|uniref:hypothetical protein n=1 Tax=Streptomyces sp. NPDC093223 TaxID=3366033 RepID=UPI00381654F2